jgi:hypothetical protein
LKHSILIQQIEIRKKSSVTIDGTMDGFGDLLATNTQQLPTNTQQSVAGMIATLEGTTAISYGTMHSPGLVAATDTQKPITEHEQQPGSTGVVAATNIE